MNILLSYPRSGNHLVRFFIELLTELPTKGCIGNQKIDKCIYQNKFKIDIPFNINKNYDSSKCFTKFHFIDKLDNYNNNLLIFIIRNPKEVLLRHNNFKYNEDSFNKYFYDIDYYLDFKGNKLLLYYEDLITNKKEFIINLYNFLKNNYNISEKKLQYVLDNIDELYFHSANPLNRKWGNVNSNFQTNFYYNNIDNEYFKTKFNNYLKKKLENEKYKFIKVKYNINLSEL
jgi:hypothetical protein